MGYSFRLAARVLLYASSHRQDNTYHGLCYTSRGALAGTPREVCFNLSIYNTEGHITKNSETQKDDDTDTESRRTVGMATAVGFSVVSYSDDCCSRHSVSGPPDSPGQEQVKYINLFKQNNCTMYKK